jgi:hypothetical protein
MMLKCTYDGYKALDKPLRFFYINNNTVIRSKKLLILENKSFIITNYNADPKDILEGYQVKSKQAQRCNKTFCHFCLKGSYDHILEIIKDKKDYLCPCCVVIYKPYD